MDPSLFLGLLAAVLRWSVGQPQPRSLCYQRGDEGVECIVDAFAERSISLRQRQLGQAGEQAPGEHAEGALVCPLVTPSVQPPPHERGSWIDLDEPLASGAIHRLPG